MHRRGDDTETVVGINLHVLPVGSRSVLNFSMRPVELNVGHTVLDVKEAARVAPQSMAILNGVILDDGQTIKQVFDQQQKENEQQQQQQQQQQPQQSAANDDKNRSLVVIACPPRFSETPEWQQNPNTVARLLNAGVVIDCALAAVSRSTWQRGFPEFFTAAQLLYKMVDRSASGSSYQRRSESVCLVNHQLQAVLPFNEFDGRLMLPPVSMRGEPCRVLGEWVCDGAREGLSRDEISAQEDKARLVRSMQPDLEKLESVVVRVFGYHVQQGNPGSAATQLNTGGGGAAMSSANMSSTSAVFGGSTVRPAAGGAAAMHVVPFTAFFVSRRFLLTTRSATYNTATGTFASTFRFTRRLRSIHAMLEDDVDLHELRVVEGVANQIASRISHLGISVDPGTIPVGLAATEWCDLLLLEVVDPAQYSAVGEYLLPELNPLPTAGGNGNNGGKSGNNNNASSDNNATNISMAATSATAASTYASEGEYGNTGSRLDNTLFCMSYPSAPSPDWLEHVFGTKGYNTAVSEEAVRKLFWSYDLKCVSVGELVANQQDEMERGRVLLHNCSVLPGSRGAPIFRQVKKTVITSEATKETLYLFAGIERGRSLEECNNQRDEIIAMSTSEIARRDSLAYNVRNEAHASNHLALVLLYQNFIAPELASHVEHRNYLQQYLAPYEIFMSQSLLSTCHRLMLRDADDMNEYGVDFYEHRDLKHALEAFRCGARMFSTAMIPNLSSYELELKGSLSQNVCSCVVALKFDDATAGAA